MSDAIPFDSLAADPDPDPDRAIRRWDRKTHAAGAPDPDPGPDPDPNLDPGPAVRRIPIAPSGAPGPDLDPGPASGAPLQPLLYLLSKLLHAPHSRF